MTLAAALRKIAEPPTQADKTAFLRRHCTALYHRPIGPMTPPLPRSDWTDEQRAMTETEGE